MLRVACSRVQVTRPCLLQPLFQQAKAWASNGAQGRLDVYETSPVLQVVRRKMEQRAELQSQVCSTPFSSFLVPDPYGEQVSELTLPAQSKQIMKQLTQTESLSAAWEEWLKTREVSATLICG